MFTPAFAQSAAAAQPGILEMLLPFVLIAVVFYFLLIRPQQKRVKDHRALIENLKRGDTVVTGGGIIGKVVRVIDDSDELELDLGNDVKIRVVRSTIMDIRGKGQPVPAKGKKTGSDKNSNDADSDKK